MDCDSNKGLEEKAWYWETDVIYFFYCWSHTPMNASSGNKLCGDLLAKKKKKEKTSGNKIKVSSPALNQLLPILCL